MIKILLKLPVFLVTIFVSIMIAVGLFGFGVHFKFPNQAIVSLAIFGLGLIVIAIGGYTFRKHKTTVNPMNPELTTSLVTNGIYRISRNPMYIGFLSCLLASALFIGNFTNFLLLPMYIILVNKLYIAPEEKALRKLFKEDFEIYSSEVSRWF